MTCIDFNSVLYNDFQIRIGVMLFEKTPVKSLFSDDYYNFSSTVPVTS